MTTKYGFPRRERLLHSREFQHVFENTQGKSADPYLVLLAAQNNCGHPRLGLAISKKKIKTAVARNRIKRLVRNSFRFHKSDLNNLDIVVIGQSRAAEIPNDVLYRHLAEHWKKLVTRCKN